jgi:peroxiredoxin
MFCRQQVAEFRPHVEELRQLGVSAYVIGSGTPDQAHQFAELLQTGDLPILSDQRRVTYRAMQFRRSVTATMLHPSTWLRGLKIAFKYRQGRTMGDPWQLGGAAVIRRDGSEAWRYVSEAGGDHPTIAALLDAARAAAAH